MFASQRAQTQSKIDGAKQRHLLRHGWCVVDGALGNELASKFLCEMQTLEQAKMFLPNKVHFTIHSNGQPVPLEVTKPNIFEVDLHDASKRKRTPTFAQLFGSDVFVDVMQRVEDQMKRMYTVGRGGAPNRQSPPAIDGHTDAVGHTAAAAAAAAGHASTSGDSIGDSIGDSTGDSIGDSGGSGCARASAAWSDEQYQWCRLVRGSSGKTIKLQVNYGGAFPLHFDNPGPPNKRR